MSFGLSLASFRPYNSRLSNRSSDAVAQVDCNANITIRLMSQLDQVRNECEVIGGDLILGANISGQADLNGIRKVTGTLDLFSCRRLRGDNCTIESGATATVLSSSLEEIGGSLRMDTPLAIQKVSFPNLSSVGDYVSLTDHGHLIDLDISNLREAGGLYLEDVSKLTALNITSLASIGTIYMWGARELKRIISNGVQNLTHGEDEGEEAEEEAANDDYYITIGDCEKLEQVGNLFARSVVPQGDKPLSLELPEGQYGPLNFEETTIAWPNMTRMDIRGTTGRVRFGNNDTESMHVKEGYARVGVGFERAQNIQNLSFDHLEIKAEEGKDEDQDTIQLPVNRLGELIVRVDRGVRVEKISLPEHAQEWGLKNLTLDLPRTKFLTRDNDDDGSIIWHWPEDLHDVLLNGLIDQNLL